MDAETWWTAWCAVHDADPVRATIIQLRDLALDLRLAGVSNTELVAIVEHAAERTGLWGTSDWATLRLALPV